MAIFNGGNGNDSQAGTNASDTYAGNNGTDTLTGADGNDSLNGGNDNDSLNGGNDNDTIVGGSGNDTIDGGAGNDTIDGGIGSDRIFSGGGNDTINGGTGSSTDTVAGSSGADTLVLTNIDVVDAGAGADTVTADGDLESAVLGDGNDQLTFSAAAEAEVNGGNNDDTVNGSSSSDELTLTGVEQLNANGGNDTVSASGALVSATLGSGNDELTFTSAANATVDGGANNDYVEGSNSADNLVLTAVEELHAMGGNDRVTVTDSTAIDVTLGAGNDLIQFLAAANATINVSSDNDTVVGSAFNDNIRTTDNGEKIERFELGDGNDTLVESGNSSDFITVLAGSGNDSLSLTSNASVDGGDGNDTLNAPDSADQYRVASVESVSLGDGDDRLTFTAGASSTVNGGFGDDSVSGSSAADSLSVTGVQHVDLGDGNDKLTVASGGSSITVLGGNGNDTILNGSDEDRLSGGAGSDHFVYTTASESTASERDRITDFTQGSDKIDLSAFDGSNDLLFNGTTSAAGRVWYEQVSGNTIVHYGTGAGHLEIRLDGLFTLTVNDFIGVIPGNSAPTIAETASASTDEDTAATGTAAGSDVDADTLSYSIDTANDGSNGTATINGSTGEWTYTPNADFNGTDSFVITVSDGTLVDTQTVTVTVNAVNDAPTIAETFAASTSEDTTATGTAVGSDVESDALTYSVADGSNGSVTINDSTGEWVYTPDADFNGTDSFVITVSDGEYSDTQTVTVTVNAENDPPVVAVTDAITIDEDTVGSGTAAGSDVDGDSLSYSAADGDHGTVSINASTGEWTYTPDANYYGTDSFVITVGDGSLSDTQVVSVTIDPVADVSDVVWVDVAGSTLTVGNVIANLTGAPAGFGYRFVAGTTAPVSVNEAGQVTLDGPWVANSEYNVNVEVYLIDGNLLDYTESFKLRFATSGNDTVTLSSDADVFYGLDGNDSVAGGGGNDALMGQNGADTLNGGTGDDRLVGGAGIDHYHFGMDAGNDSVVEAGSASNGDRIVLLTGGGALTGLDFGYDSATGFATFDYNGNSISFDQGAVGGGIEFFQFSGGTFLGVNLTTQTYGVVVNGTGTTGRDLLAGSAGADTLNGGNSTDLLFGGAGNDSLVGGAADDIMIGGGGNDTINAGGIVDSDIIAYLSADSGTDVINNFDGSPGAIQDWINLDGLFDELGFTNAERAFGAGFTIVITGATTADLYVNLDGDTSTGGAGAHAGFEYHLATVNVVSGAFDQLDVVVGTL